jgi:hypothetical protein
MSAPQKGQVKECSTTSVRYRKSLSNDKWTGWSARPSLLLGQRLSEKYEDIWKMLDPSIPVVSAPS